MGTGWAVAASTVLALSLAHVMLDLADAMQAIERSEPHEGFLPSASGPFVVALVLVCATYGAWAYAIATAAHGNKGGLAALLVLVLVWGLGLPLLMLVAAPSGAGVGGSALRYVVLGANALAGALGAWSILGELRARRGPVRGASAMALLMPLALTVLVLAASRGL